MAQVRGPSHLLAEPVVTRSRRPMSHVGMALLALSAVFFGVNFAHEWLISHQIEQTAAQLQQRIDQTNAQNQLLRSQLSYFNSKEYIVPAARAQLGMAQPQDTLMHIKQLPPRVEIVQVPAQAAAPQQSLFIRLLRSIFQ